MRASAGGDGFGSRGTPKKGVAQQSRQPGPTECFAHAAKKMSASCEGLPVVAEPDGHRQVVDSRALSAVVGAFALRDLIVVFHEIPMCHLFKTSSRFMAAL